MTLMVFGPAWDAPAYDDAQPFPETPTYAACLWCSEQFVEGDQGYVMPMVGEIAPEYRIGVGGEFGLVGEHRECLLASTAGHIVGVCDCTREDWPSREAAREVLRRMEFKKAVDAGLHGPGCGRWGCPCMQLGPVCEEAMTADNDICIRCGWVERKHAAVAP
jgi:hypothetical protein